LSQAGRIARVRSPSRRHRCAAELPAGSGGRAVSSVRGRGESRGAGRGSHRHRRRRLPGFRCVESRRRKPRTIDADAGSQPVPRQPALRRRAGRSSAAIPIKTVKADPAELWVKARKACSLVAVADQVKVVARRGRPATSRDRQSRAMPRPNCLPGQRERSQTQYL
jgi:hypothetical protein